MISLLQSHPKDPTLYLLGGNCYRLLGHPDQAILCYQEAIKLKPDFADAHNNLGVIFYDSNKINEAIIYYQEAINVDPDFADAHNNLANCLAELSRPEGGD